LANEGKRVIIFTTNPGIMEMFDRLSVSLKAAKSIISSLAEESSFLYALTERLNLSIASDLEELALAHIRPGTDDKIKDA
jgi:hypothetical protein